MKSNLLSIMVFVSVVSSVSFGLVSPHDNAKKAFGNSKQVSSAITRLAAIGYTEADDVEAVTVSGGCGFAGCDSDILVIQRMSTAGANTQTKSVKAMVKVSAVGGVSLNLVDIVSPNSNSIELPWTSDAGSTQATLKSALYQAMQADQNLEFPRRLIKGNYSKVEVADGKSKVVCEEQKAPGLIQVQQFRCLLSK